MSQDIPFPEGLSLLSDGEGNESHDDRASDDGKGIFFVLTRFVEGAKREIWPLSALLPGLVWWNLNWSGGSSLSFFLEVANLIAVLHLPEKGSHPRALGRVIM